MNNFYGILAGSLLVVFLWGLAMSMNSSPLDNTDDHITGTRGMRVLTDKDTGLQYLHHWEGGLTPRLDVNGTHMRATGREGVK